MHGDLIICPHIINHILVNSYHRLWLWRWLSFVITEKTDFDYPFLSQDFEWKLQLKMVIIYQVLTKECKKKVFPISKTLPQIVLASLKHASGPVSHIQAC